MRSIRYTILTITLLALSVVPAFAKSVYTQKRTIATVKEKTITGYISDGSCGLKHMAGMDDESCTLMCAKNGSLVLADRDHKLIYALDQAGQEKARAFAGKKVTVTGRVRGKTIRVSAIAIG